MKAKRLDNILLSNLFARKSYFAFDFPEHVFHITTYLLFSLIQSQKQEKVFIKMTAGQVFIDKTLKPINSPVFGIEKG